MSDDAALATAARFAALEARVGRVEVAERGPDWGAVVGRHLLLGPYLIGLWPFSSATLAGNVLDVSGAGRTLTLTGGTSLSLYNSLVPYADFNGTTGYYTRADETDLDITAGMTVGGWFWLDSVAASQVLMSKWNPTGNQRAWALQMNNAAPDTWRFFVSTDGISAAIFAEHTATIASGVWVHVVARFTPSTEVALFVDGVKVANTTSIPATIFNSSAAFRIGNLGDNTQFMDGRAALCFLCATALPDTLIQGLYRATKLFFQ